MKEPITTIGQVLTKDDLQERDAVHVAIVAAQAGEKLYPGQVVRFEASDSTKRVVDGGGRGDTIGIVDPFLPARVDIGDVVWVFLYPNTITSLKHVWEHPLFCIEPSDESKEPEKSLSTWDEMKTSLEWLKDFSVRAGFDSYEEMIDHVTDYVNAGQVCVQHNDERARDAYYAEESEFWRHIEVVTGMKAPSDPDYWGSPFSCSC